MKVQKASRTVPLPLERVERFLADVETWPSFLVGVESVERKGHERYRFTLRDGREFREVTACVRHNWQEHAMSWKALEGPAFRGCIQLKPVDAQRTLVELEIAAHPGSFAGGFSDMVLSGSDRATLDLRGLEDKLTSSR